MHVVVPFEQRPVEPGRFVVVTVRVIVAALRAPDLVAHQEHRRPYREQAQRKEVLNLTIAELLDRRVFGRSLDAAVPTQVVIRAVAVPLPIAFVVLHVIRDDVVERETVVTGHKVDAPFRPPSLDSKDVGAGAQTGGGLANGATVSLHEAADIITKSSVPFLPCISNKA